MPSLSELDQLDCVLLLYYLFFYNETLQNISNDVTTQPTKGDLSTD